MANPDEKFVNTLYSMAHEESTKRTNMLFVSMVSLFFILIVWASVAEIEEFTQGEGKVIPSSKIQKVQYLDGGIVSEILVKEGDRVVKNQDLLKVDTTRFQATFEETQENLLLLKVKQTRLERELDTDYTKSFKDLKFTEELEESASQYIPGQKQIYRNKFFERKNSIRIFELQYKQKRNELRELRERVKELKDAVALVKEQYVTIEKLVKSGSKSKIEFLNTKKELSGLEGELEASKLSIPRIKLTIDEYKTQVQEKVQGIKSEVSVELQDVIGEIKTIEARLVSDSDKLEKTVIKSPVDGTIKQVNLTTVGGVIQSGVDLIEIVPDSDILLVEAKIDPKDIAFINPTLDVFVKLTAYDFSIYGGLSGSIVEISADTIRDLDSQDGKSYYKVLVKTDKNYLEYNNKKLFIIPGMVATVDIKTGRKTIMDYILKPILKVREGALSER